MIPLENSSISYFSLEELWLVMALVPTDPVSTSSLVLVSLIISRTNTYTV